MLKVKLITGYSEGGIPVADLFYLAVPLLFFAASAGFVVGAQRLMEG